MNIPAYYKIKPEELGKNGRIPLQVLEDSKELMCEYALQTLFEIEKNNAAGKRTVLIVPCGPIAQHTIFARYINQRRCSLKNTWIINMDELIDENGECFRSDNKQSFHYLMQKALYDRLDPQLAPPEDHRVFPDPRDPGAIARLIERLGGVDLCMGGIALNGHIAFNEPSDALTPEEFAALPTRVVELTEATIIKNAILDLGGATDAFPRRAITVGMKEMLGARRMLVSMTLDMQRSTIRHALYGEVSASFPITLLQNHKNALIMITQNVTALPFDFD